MTIQKITNENYKRKQTKDHVIYEKLTGYCVTCWDEIFGGDED